MFKTALKSLLGHKLRLVITILAIVLGVSFMAGTFVLTDTLGKTFDDLFTSVGQGVDAQVRGEAVLDAPQDQGPLRSDIDPALTAEIEAVPGVRGASPTIQSLAIPFDKEGKVIGGGGAPNFGFNWSDVPELNPTEIVAGGPPTGPNQVVIGKSIADEGPYVVGDTIRIRTIGGTIEPEVVGIATINGSGTLVGATFVALSTDEALKYFAFGGKVQAIDVVAEPGVTQQDLVTRIAPVLPDGVEVITGQQSIDENQDLAQDQLAVFNQVLSGFALVSLVAGAFLIYNTFGIILTQRTRELALLRALGASRRQVMGSVVLEALVLGAVSAVIGLIGGVVIALGLLAVFEAIGLELPSTAPVVAPRTIVVAITLGIGITVFSAVFPARKASKVPPIAAIRDVAVDTSGASVARLVIGVVLGVLGAVALMSGAGSGELPGILGGVLVLFFALVVLGPRIAPVITRLFGLPLRRMAGVAGVLARENAVRNPKRSASTASALLLSVTIVTLLSIFAFSFGASINEATDKYLLADFQLDEGGFGFPTIAPETIEKVAALPEVGAASGVQWATVQILDEPRPVYAVRGEAAADLWDIGLLEGSLADLGTDGIAVDKATADIVGWKIGTELPTTFPDGQVRPLAIRAIYENGGMIAQNSDGHFLIDSALLAETFPAQSQFSARVLVAAADGVDIETARAALEEAVADTAIKVRDKQQIKDESNRQLNQSLSFLVMLLVLAVVIGALGIANTLALAVFERTRELGLLRAVGASRRQVNVSIFLESMLLTLFGTVLGLGLGVLGGAALIKVFEESLPTSTVSIPVPFLLGILVLSFLIGVASSVLPAWRSSRMNVLEAIAFE